MTRWLPPLSAALLVMVYAVLRNAFPLRDFSQPRREELWWAVLNLGIFDRADDNRVLSLPWSTFGLAVLALAVVVGCHWWRHRGNAWLALPAFVAFLAVLSAVKSLSFNDIAVAMGVVVVGVALVCAGVYLFRRDRWWGLAGVLGVSLTATVLRPVDGFLLVIFAVLMAYAVVERGAVLAVTSAAYLAVLWWPQWTLDHGAGGQFLSADQLDPFWLTARVYAGPVIVLLLGALVASAPRLNRVTRAPDDPT
ncbi:hypothetical protein NLX83_33180 [Allokutzneria sp. A3M-2-11 16]|uniref:hypothetical protein n=1 Tax=Allokutzneria sp. A3M-2-11 16 TaxID=2962043 RepID=UPI0020B8AED7|nr:hypothetical protein [Allokutzneria sp. A3M-2-11 16]MCP3804137.1 hypothetical protein [Allokutzneria sp. A3M-2-11 16]